MSAPTGTWHQRFSVEIDYPVVFTRAVCEPGNAALSWAVSRLEPDRKHRCAAIVDGGVADAWPGLADDLSAYADAHGKSMELVAEPQTIPGGEASKNDAALVGSLQDFFAAHHMDRQSCVLVFGGGAVLDVAGYAAATTHRGLRVVRLPTTVLAQNDAGIGVKNGINAYQTKNFLGTFAAPFAVINDVDFIGTLEPRDAAAGIAEAVKVALIRDAEFFTALEAERQQLGAFEKAAMERMIRRCAELHLHHIRSSGDPFETGSARPLDFGHWAAHKLEGMTGHSVRHGEAVAIGLALDTKYSTLTQGLSDESCERVCALLESVGLELWHEALGRREDGRLAVLRGLEDFREHLGGELTVTLLSAIGHGVEVHAIDADVMADAIAWLGDR